MAHFVTQIHFPSIKGPRTVWQSFWRRGFGAQEWRCESTEKYFKNILHALASVLVSTSAFVFDGGLNLVNH